LADVGRTEAPAVEEEVEALGSLSSAKFRTGEISLSWLSEVVQFFEALDGRGSS
jgi:hypothetical protein